MRLKTLALVVCISQGLLLALGIWNAIGSPSPYRLQAFIRIALSVPLLLFFFYVWKRGKDT